TYCFGLVLCSRLGQLAARFRTTPISLLEIIRATVTVTSPLAPVAQPAARVARRRTMPTPLVKQRWLALEASLDLCSLLAFSRLRVNELKERLRKLAQIPSDRVDHSGREQLRLASA